ncbi:SpoIIE family protein phosphatase [Sphaerisporangium sp. NPDC004334]
MLSWVDRGHHPPVVIRDGRWTTTLHCPPAHPMGLDLGLVPIMCREQLQPGVRVLFYTDGIAEARNPQGREFVPHRFVEFMIRTPTAFRSPRPCAGSSAACWPITTAIRKTTRPSCRPNGGHDSAQAGRRGNRRRARTPSSRA